MTSWPPSRCPTAASIRPRSPPSTVKLYPTGSPARRWPSCSTRPAAATSSSLGRRRICAPNTSYTFEVTAGCKDVTGVGFAPFTSTFTTGTQVSPVDTSIQFQKVALANVPTGQYTAVTIGPDGKLYAAGVAGHIFRWKILADGTLGAMETLDFVARCQRRRSAAHRLDVRPQFDGRQPDRVGHAHVPGVFQRAGVHRQAHAAFRPEPGNVQDFVINLPRSAIDHVTNQIDFGPDGALYFLQGSISAMGAPDNAWGLRDEVLLSAAVLRFDPALWNAAVNGPLDVHTEDADPYDPFAPARRSRSTPPACVTPTTWSGTATAICTCRQTARRRAATRPARRQFRRADCLPRIDEDVNGPYTGPVVPALNGVSTQRDWLFRIDEGGYYGHPNPTRNEFVLNGGNPTGGDDPAQVSEYPVGTLPDRNWRGFAFDFGLNRSPDGVIEYKYGGFGGALVGKLLVARFSSGDDIIVLEPGLDGNIVSSNDAIASFDGFNDPLDLVENPHNGILYVSQFDRSGGQGTITLLRPQEPNIVVNKTN